MKRLGRPAAETVERILACLDAPPVERLSAFVDGRRMDVDGESFDRTAAARLAEVTRKLPASHVGAR